MALLAVAACSSTDEQESGAACGPGGQCPAGFTCDSKTNVCLPSSPPDARIVPDGRVGGPDAVPSDAGGTIDGPPTSSPAALAIDSEAHDFGPFTIGQTSPTKTFTVTNTGGTATLALAASVAVTATFVCPGGTSLCNGLCVDLTSDENNCGTCGNVCVAESCVDRVCETTVTQGAEPTQRVGAGHVG